MKKYRGTLLLTLLFLCSTIAAVQAQSVGGVTSGTASYCSGDNSGFISLTGHNGAIVDWEFSTDLVIWTGTGNITTTQSYLDLTQTTHYRAIVQDGANPPDTSTISTITIFVPADGGTIAGAGTFCEQTGTGTLTLSGEIGNVLYWQWSDDGGATWNQVANTTTTLNHPNITQNTIYNAVVENEPSCPTDTSADAVFTIDAASIAGTLASGDTVCEGINSGTLVLSGNFSNVVDWISSTDNGTTWNSLGNTSLTEDYLNLTQTTLYQAISVNGVCPADTTTAIELVVVQPNPADAGSDVDIINHETTILNGVGVGSVVWSPSTGLDNPNTLTPAATPNQTTTYYITLTNQWGCVSTDSVTVTVEIPIPSAITPNNDGVNDFFVIDKIENLPENSLMIYNRQGQVVYEKSPYENQWDGRSDGGEDLPDGVYYYVLQLTPSDEAITGFVLIKR